MPNKHRPTPMQLFMDWLSNQPPLVLKSEIMLKCYDYHRKIEVNHLKAAYQQGYDNYSHPKNYTLDASEWYAQKYNRVQAIGCRKQKPTYKPIKNVTTKPIKSIRKRDLR